MSGIVNGIYTGANQGIFDGGNTGIGNGVGLGLQVENILPNAIVRNGLVLYLDASQNYSYPRSGTTWRDISGNNNNGTLTNGPTFNSVNGESIVFDGTNDFSSFPGNTFGYSPGTTGEISLEMWIYPTGPYTSFLSEPPTTNLAGVFGQSYFNNSVGWGLGITTLSGINFFVWQVRNFGSVVAVGSTTTSAFVNNNWYHVVGTINRTTFSRLYINGVNLVSNAISSAAVAGLTITPNISDASIGKGGGLPFYAGCRISIARIYNRALTATEVLQNYNATKSRFGL